MRLVGTSANSQWIRARKRNAVDLSGQARLEDFDIEAYRREGFCELGRRLTPKQVTSVNDLFDQLDGEASLSDSWEAQYDTERGVRRLRKLRRLLWNKPELFCPMISETGLLDVAEEVIGSNAGVVFHAAFLKPALIGTAVGLHQDQALWQYDYPNAFSAWFALTEVDQENGGLGGYPRSHQAEIEHTDDPEHPWHPTIDLGVHPLGQFHNFDLCPGDAVMWDRYFAHSSAANRSIRDRRGMVLVFVDMGVDGFQSKECLSLSDIRSYVESVC